MAESFTGDVSRFELAFLLSSPLPVTGSLKPLWHSPQWWQILPEDSTAATKCIVLLVNPLLRGDPRRSCNWPHLLVLASASAEAYYPEKSKTWEQVPEIQLPVESGTCQQAWGMNVPPPAGDWDLLVSPRVPARSQLDQPISRKYNHTGVFDPGHACQFSSPIFFPSLRTASLWSKGTQ